MRSIAVIGAGITGVTTAYALARRGFSVTLFERHRYAAMETSFANGGQLSGRLRPRGRGHGNAGRRRPHASCRDCGGDACDRTRAGAALRRAGHLRWRRQPQDGGAVGRPRQCLSGQGLLEHRESARRSEPGRHANVFYNTGHGHLGWTLSAATAELVAEQLVRAREAAH